jgi:DNA-binding Lrp family transcriptional regulator
VALQKYSDDDILKPLARGGMTTTEWQRDLSIGIGLSPSGFHDRLRKLKARDAIKKEGKKWVLK